MSKKSAQTFLFLKANIKVCLIKAGPKVDSESRPKIEIDQGEGSVVVTSDAGVPWVGFWVGDEIVAHREFKDSPREVTLTLSEIQNQLGKKSLRKVTAIGINGKSRSEKVESSE